jgi:signal transduction histidine kinase
MRFNSLAFRLIATAAAWMLLVLPTVGLIIHSYYRNDVQASFDARIKVLLTVVLADSLDHGDAEPGAPRDIGEPLFEVTNSGWYWQIKPVDGSPGLTRVSASLASGSIPSLAQRNVEQDIEGIRWAILPGPNGEILRVAEMMHGLGSDDAGPGYSYIVTGPQSWPEQRIAAFRLQLAGALALVGIGLTVLTLLQVRFGLAPLREIEKGLAAIRSGDSVRLAGELPTEIEPLRNEINALIQSNEEIVDRARTQVGNLAHALKTPLAVIANEAREDKGQFAQKVAEQALLMGDQVNYYLDRARMAARAGMVGRVTDVRPVIESLARVLERLNHDKGIAIGIECDERLRFQGEKQDLEEMLGNLADNACKWAKGVVRIRGELSPQTSGNRKFLVITVEDDGPGLSEDQRRRIGKRGMRLDESKPGSGLGLSIVGDLAASYRGRFELGMSELGGLSVALLLPAA